jgi:hypothetical protein
MDSVIVTYLSVCKYDSIVLIFLVKVMTLVSLYMKLDTDKTKVTSTMLTTHCLNQNIGTHVL